MSDKVLTDEQKKVQDLINNNFVDDNEQDEEQKIISFVKAILSLEIEKKEISTDIREIKKEAKQNGLSVRDITATVQAIMKEMKKTPSELSEIEHMRELLLKSLDVKMMMDRLVHGE